ncbi:acyltransferase family protein [Falsirhodobacter sp. 20TX0035]|uniref:acyltransferase family protein n=1 Tax=Falsirhodobacter sp. 20TX0035 TaxID=3022019 RepID=UPI00232C6CAF|nr:acyltransferase [Falsirhodobacter sp. 20TX0035]MDB6455114.1 acyltransferase [Falsirhodobacter sp. 20TX0035]
MNADAQLNKGSRRESWLDILRGVTITLVIFHHCYLTTAAMLTEAGSGLHLPWYSVDRMLGMVRMPAFFLCSGILFSTVASRGWSWFLRKRLAWTIWIAMVWGWIAACVLVLGVDLYPWGTPGQIRLSQWALITPIGNMWFIYAIAILAAWSMVLVNTGKAASFILSIVLAVTALLLYRYTELPAGIDNLVLNLGYRGFVFFSMGFVFAKTLLKTRKIRGIHASLALAVWTVCYFIHSQATGPHDLLRLLLSIPATLSVVYALRYLVIKCPQIWRPFELLGRRSLELFLTHQFIIALTFILLHPLVGHIIGDGLVAILFVLTLALSIMVSAVLRRAPSNAFFALPSGLFSRTQRNPNAAG